MAGEIPQEILQAVLAMSQGGSPNSAPQGQPQGGPQQGSAIQKQVDQNLKPKSSIAPLGMNPKMKQSSLGVDVGLNLLNMFVPQIGGTLQQHIKKQKEQQINQVVNDFTTLHNAWEEAQQIAGGDEEKAKQMFGQDPRVAALFSDKKKLKLLSKAYGVDLMNPEKTTNNVAFQGLQRFLKLKDAKGQADAVRQMKESASQKSQSQPQQPQQGQSGQGGPQAEPKPEELAQNFLKMWPKEVKQPSMADVEKAAQTEHAVVETAMAGEPKTEFQAWYKAKSKEGKVTSADVEAHHEASKLKPQDALIGEAIDDIQNGDVEAGKQKIELVHQIAQATHPQGHKNFVDLISGANAGNKEDAQDLKTYMALQDEMREAYGKGRARYQYMSYTMPDGTIRPMSGLDMFNWIRQHPNELPPIPTGRVTAAQDISIQQLINEAGPVGSPTYNTGALKGMYDNIAAFDNAKDRAIFSQAWNHVQHTSDWFATMQNVLGQAELDNLSPEGQNLHVALQRMNETMGRFRSSMGLPSTDQSMAISLALLPGGKTNSSEIAKKLLDNINTMIEKAKVAALGGKPSKPQAEKKKMTLDEFFNQKPQQGAQPQR